MTDKGLDGNKIATKGYGESCHIAVNITPKTKRYNRRAEFKVLKQGENQKLIVKPIEVPEEYRRKLGKNCD